MKFTVIIIAHKRKDFILTAVKSVIDQDFPKQNIEIIVIKNFIDEEIDRTLSQTGVNLIYNERDGLSDKVKRGIKESHGEMISLLEDDDFFLSGKLSNIAQILNDNSGLDYIHNEQYSSFKDVVYQRSFYSSLNEDFLLDKERYPLLKLIGRALYFNLSSVTISRRLGNEIIRILPDNLINVVDICIFLIAFEMNDSKIYFTERKLTTFNVHESSHLTFREFAYFFGFEKSLSEIEHRELESIKDATSTAESLHCLECLQNSWKLRNSLFSRPSMTLSGRYNLLVNSYLCSVEAINLSSIFEIFISLLNFISPQVAARFFFSIRKIRAL
jgi:glycosyltransferase involved in cell wall biosynthesis